MWLAFSSIVLASAIGLNVLALWLTGWLERNQPTEPVFTDGNGASAPQRACGHGFLPKGAKLLSAM
jgi:hypothetical protein